MAESPGELLAQAAQLETRLRDQQAELQAQQKALEETLRVQIAATEPRQVRRTRIWRRTWRILGLFPIALLLLAQFNLSKPELLLAGGALLALQVGAFLEDRADRETSDTH